MVKILVYSVLLKFFILVLIGEKLCSQTHYLCEQNNYLDQNNKNVLHILSLNFSHHIIIILNKKLFLYLFVYIIS